MDMHGNTTGRTIGGAAEEGASKAERFSESAHGALDRATENVSSTIRQAGQKGEELGRKGEQLGREWLETQDAWLQQACEYVRQHPIASVAVALGVGMLLGRRRSR